MLAFLKDELKPHALLISRSTITSIGQMFLMQSSSMLITAVMTSKSRFSSTSRAEHCLHSVRKMNEILYALRTVY